jgi:hypothetical protein
MQYIGKVASSHQSRRRDGWRIVLNTDKGAVYFYTRPNSPLNEPRGAKPFGHGASVVIEATQVGDRNALAIDDIKLARDCLIQHLTD